MNTEGKKFYVEVGEHIDTTEDTWLYENEAPPSDGIYWSRRGPLTDSFAEVEARSVLLSKTYKNVRLASQEIEVIGYVEG